jgi:hypothetical protein
VLETTELLVDGGASIRKIVVKISELGDQLTDPTADL